MARDWYAQRLGPRDIEVLRTLLLGTVPDVRSNHRLRLELLGLVRDGAKGLKLTAAGREALAEVAATKTDDRSPVEEERQRDALGQKRNMRRWVLS